MHRYLAAIAFLILLATPTFADNGIGKDWSRFFEMRDLVKEKIAEVGTLNQVNPDRIVIEKALDNAFEELEKQIPQMQHMIFSAGDGEGVVVTAVIDFEDEQGFMGWKFDTLFTEGNVVFYQLQLNSREIPQNIKMDEYYQWKLVPKVEVGQ